jgi:hypothetical protein
MAATAVGAAVVAKVAPELFADAAQSKPVQEIAAEIGLFGAKTASIFDAVRNEYAEPKYHIWQILKRGDQISVKGADSVQLGYQYANLPDHPLMRRDHERPRGMIEAFKIVNGMFTVPYDMEVFTAHDKDGARVRLEVTPADTLKPGEERLLINAEKPAKPLSDLEAYIEKRKAEGVNLDNIDRTSHRRGFLRERERHDAGDAGTIGPTPLALAAAEKALATEQTDRWVNLLGESGPSISWGHPSRKRKLLVAPPLAKPMGYLPA